MGLSRDIWRTVNEISAQIRTAGATALDPNTSYIADILDGISSIVYSRAQRLGANARDENMSFAIDEILSVINPLPDGEDHG